MKNSQSQIKYLIALDKLIAVIENPHNERKHLTAIERMLHNFYEIYDSKINFMYHDYLKDKFKKLKNRLK